VPRTTKDVIEERLFERRRDLFSELSLVFIDTTTLYFEGAGGQTLGAYGFSKDHRPDHKQIVVAVVIDGAGHPLCCELLPGNVSDLSVLRNTIAHRCDQPDETGQYRSRIGTGHVVDWDPARLAQ
jgi:transposase